MSYLNLRARGHGLLPGALVAAVLALGSCGGAANHPMPDNAAHQRAQIKALLADIERLESEQQGDAVGVVKPTINSAGDGDGDGDGDSDSPATAPQRLSTRTESGSSDAQPWPPMANVCYARADQRTQRCTSVCKLAENICTNAGSICRLAEELGNDDWARDRCAQASSSCTRADQRCCQC